MKKIAFYLLAVCLLLSGCAGWQTPEKPGQTAPSAAFFDNPDPMPEYDEQNKYLLVRGPNFRETEDFFFGSSMGENYLYYYDKKSSVSGILCADPACTHDSLACGAYVETGTKMSYYEGKRYWIAQESLTSNDYYLWRGDLSGNNREKVKRLDFEDVILAYQPQLYAIHRGKLYILGEMDYVAGTKSAYRAMLLSSPLDSSEEFTTLFDETVECGIQPTLRFVGNAVYLSLYTFEPDGPADLKIIKYSAVTGEAETVYEETGIREMLGPVWVTPQGEIYLPGADEKNAYVWKLEDGKRTEVVSWSGDTPDVPDIMDGVAVCTGLVEGGRYIDIQSLSGEPVYSGKLFPEEVPGIEGDPNSYERASGYGYYIVGGDADKLIVGLDGYGERDDGNYILMLDLHDNLKPTILWNAEPREG